MRPSTARSSVGGRRGAALCVAIDARTVYGANRRGTGKTLVEMYRRVAARHPDWTFLMFHRNRRVTEDPFTANPNVSQRYIDIRGDRFGFWEHVRLPIGARTGGAAVLHAPANTAPLVAPMPLVLTIHDLIPFDAGDGAGVAWGRTVGRGARTAARILTPSAYTRVRLIEEFGIAADKITVNAWAADSAYRPVTDTSLIDEMRAKYGMRRGQAYLFGFAAPDPRKNTSRIVAAWAGLPDAVRRACGLLMVGLDDPDALRRVRAEADRLAPDGGWSLMPFASEADLPVLLSGATALVYASLSEGFGLPLLDAFQCCTPVITSNTTSLPEVAGDAALLIDPTDVGAIRDAMGRVATDPDLANALRRRGLDRLEHFSWQRCAETAAEVLRAAALGGRPS